MKKIMALAAVLAAMVTMMSCDKYDDGRPSKDVRSEFNRMYPEARDVEWEFNGLYWEVDFETGSGKNAIDHSAWYDKGGNWIQTKTEMAYTSVPQKIKDYLAASEYGDARMEDYFVDFYETQSGNFYRFDVYLDGREVEIDVTEDGKVSVAEYGF